MASFKKGDLVTLHPLTFDTQSILMWSVAITAAGYFAMGQRSIRVPAGPKMQYLVVGKDDIGDPVILANGQLATAMADEFKHAF